MFVFVFLPQDLSYKEKHWHEACFLCNKCRISLVDKQFGSKAEKIYCGNCYDSQFASRCDGCGEVFRAGEFLVVVCIVYMQLKKWHFSLSTDLCVGYVLYAILSHVIFATLALHKYSMHAIVCVCVFFTRLMRIYSRIEIVILGWLPSTTSAACTPRSMIQCINIALWRSEYALMAFRSVNNCCKSNDMRLTTFFFLCCIKSIFGLADDLLIVNSWKHQQFKWTVCVSVSCCAY